jgi:hypothetical protein
VKLVGLLRLWRKTGSAISFAGWRQVGVLLTLLVLMAGLAKPYVREGDYTIRFEALAVLQSGVPIPFHIKVEDARHQPMTDAKVSMQIETSEHNEVQMFKATAMGAGIYSAKPIFPEPGEWLVMVSVHHDDLVSARTITFEVASPQN